jgi:uncharacterized membrane protein
MLLEMQQAAPNTGNFLLLVLAVWGAIADNRYTRKGGKRAPKWAAFKLAAAFALLLAVFGLRGSSADSIACLAGTFFVVAFAGYEAWRLYVRRGNPLPNWK